MTHAHQRRLRGARFLHTIAGRLRSKSMRRGDNAPFKVPHADVAEFQTLCARLAHTIEREAANFRRRR